MARLPVITRYGKIQQGMLVHESGAASGECGSPLVELLSRTSSSSDVETDVERSKYFKTLGSLEKPGGERVQGKAVRDARAIALAYTCNLNTFYGDENRIGCKTNQPR
jgi:hypothetical protein